MTNQKTMKNRKPFRSRILATIMLFAIAASLVLPQQRTAFAAPTDYTTAVVVTDWDLLDSADAPLSDTNGVVYLQGYKLHVAWTLTPVGDTLHEDDTFTINLPQNASSPHWSALNGSWADFEVASQVIGQWRLYGNQIEAKFNANAEGLNSVTGSFTSGQSAVWNSTRQSLTQAVILGSVTKQIKFNGLNLIPLGPVVTENKSAFSTSNNIVRWRNGINYHGAYEMGTTIGVGPYTNRQDFYFEDSLAGQFESLLHLRAEIMVPYTIDPFDPDYGRPSTAAAYEMTVPLTRLTPNAGESYADFKTRLQPMQWGVYTDGAGKQTVILYLGTIGVDGPKYSDLFSDFAARAAARVISDGLYDESDRAALITYFTDAFGDGNFVGGQVVTYRFEFYEKYPMVISSTPVTNTATINETGKSSKTVSGTGTLEGVSETVTVSKNMARVYLSDIDTFDFLNNVPFTLQIRSGGAWVNYTSWAGGSTNTDGYVDTPNLGVGEYRFVQQAAYSADYDLPSSNAGTGGYDSTLQKCVSLPFTITAGDTNGKIVLMTNIKYKYFPLTYDLNDGSVPPLAVRGGGDASESVRVGAVIASTASYTKNTTTNKPTRDGYTFGGWYEEVGCTTAVTGALKMPAGAKTLFAKWIRIPYTVNFVPNNGTTEIPDQTPLYYGEFATDPGEPPTKPNGESRYVWQGKWYLQSGTEYNFTTPVTGNLTLYGRWAPVVYTLVFDPNGGTFAAGATPINQLYTDTTNNWMMTAMPEEPTRTYHKFLGWFDGSAGGTEFDPALPYSVTASNTYYANWEEIVYTVKYTPGLHGTFAEQTTAGLHEGDATPAAPATLGDAGWQFTGWSPEPSATVTGNATYVAQWIYPIVIPSPSPSPNPSPEPSPSPSPSAEPSAPPSEEPSLPPTGIPSAPPSSTPTPPVVTPTPGNPGGTLVPGDDGSFIEIGEDGTPQGEWHLDPDTGEWIFEEYPPQGEYVPATGDAGVLVWAFAAVAATGAVVLTRKKRA